MKLWRISKYADLTGRGGALMSGRWHRRGTPVVYCSDHPSTTLLEVLVHMDFEDLPPSYTLLKIDCPDDISLHVVSGGDVDCEDNEAAQIFGDSLLQEGAACLISVPSVIMPEARNILINPRHSDASRINIESVTSHPLDKRLRGG